jgi:hypothetical protein
MTSIASSSPTSAVSSGSRSTQVRTSVFPYKLIPQRMERVNSYLCAANGITIPTYGWLPVSLNLGCMPGLQVAIRGGRRHASPHRRLLTILFWPLGGLSKQPPTPTGRGHVVVCPGSKRQLADLERQGH